ncbi:hypothetical protein GUITHDRAFT_110352 [Guillardia theta CCMP2712]|uniref:PHD-type domain-containing protein n=1 Tax=Guillardia theta (strain CCMP2712) TaxID=905079 RepID=L1J4W0_GUITC|nr:hypothetical protein GUITHDRAFT_110352 [Guillardia theta CCMP2712]EKX43546.1 hypothetical protein GUITHDRAFT_110352 [Guillardia theta CCMP2712]|eukprot:XP_005830526.1 hypothetical protein GUITHDRAFT_110352 [Guillardia theta CCMP2712]
MARKEEAPAARAGGAPGMEAEGLADPAMAEPAEDADVVQDPKASPSAETSAKELPEGEGKPKANGSEATGSSKASKDGANDTKKEESCATDETKKNEEGSSSNQAQSGGTSKSVPEAQLDDQPRDVTCKCGNTGLYLKRKYHDLPAIEILECKACQETVAVCGACGAKMSSEGGHLRRHVRKHIKESEEYRDQSGDAKENMASRLRGHKGANGDSPAPAKKQKVEGKEQESTGEGTPTASKPSRKSTSSTPGKPRIRACFDCSKMKLRCDGERPCSSCIKSGKECKEKPPKTPDANAKVVSKSPATPAPPSETKMHRSKALHDNDDWCRVCKLGGDLLLCDGANCRWSFHLDCLYPPLSKPPSGEFLCLNCQDKRLNDSRPPVKVVKPKAPKEAQTSGADSPVPPVPPAIPQSDSPNDMIDPSNIALNHGILKDDATVWCTICNRLLQQSGSGKDADQLDDGEEDTEEELEDSILNESTSADPPEKETGDGKDTDVKMKDAGEVVAEINPPPPPE